MPQQLSSKDNSLFRQVVRNYEAKQYKKGIKAADQVLRKNPNHGDTRAMKALILNSQGHSEEAFTLAKIALKNDMKSHVCWHVYGLLYRSQKNLDEAIKAYQFALRLDPESPQIQRDLAQLQVQMRDYQGYIQSRMAMLKAKPAFRQNWTALAVAYHLAGELAQAEDILVKYEETLKSAPSKTDLEHSEAVLYRNTIIAETGDIERALEHLDSIFKYNLDRTAVMEIKAGYLVKLGKNEEAEKAYRALLDRNSEYRQYYEGLEKALGLDRSDESSHSKLVELYESFAEKNSRADAPRRIPLDFLKGDQFRTAADAYLRRRLSKGAPSTFANVKALYASEAKKQTIEDLVIGYLSEKPMNGSAKEKTNGEPSDRFEQSVLFFLAQHYNYHLSRDPSKALEYIDRAIELDPKSVDYTMTKARIFKNHGNSQKASETMEQARQLDERDRYINTKCAKYQLRNNENENALKTMSKFTRNETAGGPLGDLHDMQCMWYITEDGEACARQRKLGLALKRFKAAYDIFDIWTEDQFDFHYFSLRKGQIRAYIELVKWEDRLREHPFYSRVAIGAVKLYILLHDDPHQSLANGIPNLEDLDPSERKKALKKAKKEQEKQERAEAEKREAEKKAAAKKPPTGADGEVKKEDSDPNGTKLVQTETPLEDAMKYLTPLLELSPNNIEAQNVGFEVFIRKGKYLLALKSLLAASKIDPENPTLHEQLVRFRRALDSLPEPLSPKVSEVISSNSSIVPQSSALSKFNDEYLSSHKDSPPHVLAGLRTRQLLDPANQPQNEKDLSSILESGGVSLKDAKEGLSLLTTWKSSKEVKTNYSSAAAKIWPDASAFQTS